MQADAAAAQSLEAPPPAVEDASEEETEVSRHDVRPVLCKGRCWSGGTRLNNQDTVFIFYSWNHGD